MRPMSLLSAQKVCTLCKCVTGSSPALIIHQLLDPALLLSHLLLVLPVRVRETAAVNKPLHTDRARLQGTHNELAA